MYDSIHNANNKNIPYHGIYIFDNTLLLGGCKSPTILTSHNHLNTIHYKIGIKNKRIKTIEKYKDLLILGLDDQGIEKKILYICLFIFK